MKILYRYAAHFEDISTQTRVGRSQLIRKIRTETQNLVFFSMNYSLINLISGGYHWSRIRGWIHKIQIGGFQIARTFPKINSLRLGIYFSESTNFEFVFWFSEFQMIY